MLSNRFRHQTLNLAVDVVVELAFTLGAFILFLVILVVLVNGGFDLGGLVRDHICQFILQIVRLQHKNSIGNTPNEEKLTK